uniref:MORN repeat variant n=1 Tax=Roseihalotalea indica TaxID=2867963 RepID=A0AA49GPA8_9BACT|nr:hypothetical protein K4G66_07170 [Tunicatimonas sp. TK19036]
MSWFTLCCLLSGWAAPNVVSNSIEATSVEATSVEADTLYGTYILSKEKLSLNLSPPNNYTLFVMQYNDQSEAVTSQELSRGVFEMKADTLVLEDMASGKAMKLEVASEEKLHPMNVPNLDDDLLFLGHNQYYPNGELKWEGEWRKGKKHGNWIYYDEDGNIVETMHYKRGKKQD